MCTGTSGQINEITIRCRDRSRCLLLTSQLDDKLEAYQSSIERNNIWIQQHGKKYEITNFLYYVTNDSRMRYATRTIIDGGSVDLFAECFKQDPDKAGNPRDASTTLLWKEWKHLERNKEHFKNNMEHKSQEFVDKFQEAELQTHMTREHENELDDLLSKYLLTMHFSKGGLQYLEIFWNKTSDERINSILKFAEIISQKSVNDSLSDKEQIVLSCLLTYLIKKLSAYLKETKRNPQQVLDYIRPDFDYFKDVFGVQ